MSFYLHLFCYLLVICLVHPVSAFERTAFQPHPNNPRVKSNFKNIKIEEKPKDNREPHSEDIENTNMISYQKRLEVLSRLSKYHRLMTRFYGRVE